MKRKITLAALALAALCVFSTPASAQRGRGVYRGGYRAGYGGYRGGYYGGYRGGYYGYRGGYGYGTGLGFGVGLGTGIALGSTLGGYGYGGYGGYAPYYGGYGSYGYVPSTTYVAPSTTYIQPGMTYIQPDTTYIPPGTTYIQPGTTYVPPVAPSLSAVPADSSRQSGYYAPEVPDNAAHLRILAPADAKIWVGGVETGRTGPDRSFSSPPLTPGKSYTYEVTARWTEAGTPVEQTRKVKVEANRTSTVDFGQPAVTK